MLDDSLQPCREVPVHIAWSSPLPKERWYCGDMNGASRATPNLPGKTVRLVGACAGALCFNVQALPFARSALEAARGCRTPARFSWQATIRVAPTASFKAVPAPARRWRSSRAFEAILALSPEIPGQHVRIAYAILGCRLLRAGKDQRKLKGTLPGGRAGRSFACSICAAGADAGAREAWCPIL